MTTKNIKDIRNIIELKKSEKLTVITNKKKEIKRNKNVKKFKDKMIIKDIRNLVVRFFDDDVLAIAAQVAYDLILAFFPFLIFLLTLVGYSSLKSQDILSMLQNVLPKEVYQLIHSTVLEVVSSRKGDLLSFSLIVTIWSGSSGFRAIMQGLNKAYDEKETRAYWKKVLISIIFMFGLTFVIMFTFALLVFGEMLGNALVIWLNFSNAFRLNWNIIRYCSALAVMILGFATIYRFIPCRRLTWKEVMPGATFSTLGWLVSSLGFAYYVNNFNNYSAVYGGIGAVIALMLWMYITSIMIILGGELNAVIAFDREGKQKQRGKKF